MPKPPPSLWQRTTETWASKTDIDWPTYKVIFKDTLAPLIGLAANQATPWSNLFGTLGFLVPMASIISHPSPPRAEFLWTWATNILGSCISAAVTALAFFCVIKAREQSEVPVTNASDAPYNAMASTVAAIWLIVQVYVASAIRHNYPSTTWMVSACLIFSNYGMVYVVQFTDMATAYTFLRELLLAHLVGFAISAGVSLLVFPTNSREHFDKTVADCTTELRLALRTNISLMEHAALVTESPVPPELETARKRHKVQLDSLQAKLVFQVKNAQNEIVWGRLTPADLHTLTHLLENVVIPLIGLCQVPEILEHPLLDNGNDEKDGNSSSQQYRELLGSVVKPFSQALTTADAGLRCGEAAIGLNVSSHIVHDASADKIALIAQLQREKDLLVDSKANLLNAWHAQHDSLHGDSSPNASLPHDFDPQNYDASRENLHMLLYTELLLWSICHRVQELLIWTEELKASQKLEGKGLIIPKWMELKSFADSSSLWLGVSKDTPSKKHDVRQSTKNSRRISPRTTWSFALCLLQKCTRFFASSASGFALRVTSATMSIAIVAYLPSTQNFYIKQHLVWAQYAVSYAMQGSAGQGVRALVFRMGGTIAAVCLAWVSWYIVVGVPAGVLVFYWLSLHFPMYMMAVKPRFSTVGSVSAFALTTVLGNALQPHGTGQPTIILGAVRLAAIAGGCLLATIWTLFPFPVGDHDGARRSLGSCLACLAEYHAGFHEIVRVRLGAGLKQERRESPDRELDDMHARLLAKCNSHLHALHSQLRLTKWNFWADHGLGSHAQYVRAAAQIDKLIRKMQLLTFATGSFLDFMHAQPPTASTSTLRWLVDFRDLFHAAQRDGLGVATLLSLLAHSVRHETPLPPELIPPGSEKLWKYFDEPERIAQQIQRIDDPGAATFALMRIGTKGLYQDLGELFQIIKDMVGEFEFVCGFAVDAEE